MRCPNGYGRTKINNTFFERKLATQRDDAQLEHRDDALEWATTCQP